MKAQTIYLDMTVQEGVTHAEQHYTKDELKNIASFQTFTSSVMRI